MAAIAILAAKGTSKRVPAKNYRAFHGHPMLSYPIAAAQRSGLFDEIIVSSDSQEVLSIAEQLGATPKARPLNLTLDHIGPLEVAQYVLKGWPRALSPRICIIYPTAAMLLPEDLHRGYCMLRGHSYALSINSDPAQPLRDAAMFIWCRASALALGMPLFSEETALVPIAKERVVDINLESDWRRAERMYADLYPEAVCA